MLFVLKRIARRLDGRLLSFPMLQSGAPGSEISVVTMVTKQGDRVLRADAVALLHQHRDNAKSAFQGFNLELRGVRLALSRW